MGQKRGWGKGANTQTRKSHPKNQKISEEKELERSVRQKIVHTATPLKKKKKSHRSSTRGWAGGHHKKRYMEGHERNNLNKRGGGARVKKKRGVQKGLSKAYRIVRWKIGWGGQTRGIENSETVQKKKKGDFNKNLQALPQNTGGGGRRRLRRELRGVFEPQSPWGFDCKPLNPANPGNADVKKCWAPPMGHIHL